MFKKSILLIFFAIIFAGGIFYAFTKKKKIESIKPVENMTIQADRPAQKNETHFFVSAWLPYWAKENVAASFEKNISNFDEIHPFSFGVDSYGGLKDTLKIGLAPWPQLQKDAKEKKVSVVPTILWGDAKAMHAVFGDSNLLNNHIENIANLLEKNDFSGVDIDYEGKDVADKDIFSVFLQKLHEKLISSKKTLNCTIEARTQDLPPAGWNGTRTMAFANDPTVLDKNCDSVTVMAYDEVFQVNGIKKSFENSSETIAAPNSDNQWVEQVIQYALKSIAPEKLVLGVATYGWEFQFKKLSHGYKYERMGSVSFEQAMAEAKMSKVSPARNDGGELSFVYDSASGKNIVTFSDAQAIKQKMEIAKKYGIKGVSLFKLDGLSDLELFSVLKR